MSHHYLVRLFYSIPSLLPLAKPASWDLRASSPDPNRAGEQTQGGKCVWMHMQILLSEIPSNCIRKVYSAAVLWASAIAHLPKKLIL